MSKKLAKSDVNVQSMEQMVDRMKDGLSRAYNELADKPEAQAALLTLWDQVQQLGNANNDLMALLQGNRAALDEVKYQRDKALEELRLTQFDLDEAKNYGIGMAQKRLGKMIAAACKLPLPDAERIVAVLVGEKTTSEGYAANMVVEALQMFGNVLYAEDMFNQFAEDKTED